MTTNRCSALPPATNTYVRYLFDSQLFNIPNNEYQFRFLLTYLYYERIFEVAYVVQAAINDNRVFQRAGNRNGIAGHRFKRRRWAKDGDAAMASRSTVSGIRDDDGGTNRRENYDDDFGLLCEKTYEQLVKPRRNSYDEQQPMFNVSANALMGIQPPVDQRDVRSYMQAIKLTGNETTDWLDLKIQLCLPSIVLFFKLQGSVTNVSNADYTIEINLRELQLLATTTVNDISDTFGHKLARTVAYVRQKFFNVPVPDFDRLHLLDETDLYTDDLRRRDDENDAAINRETTSVAETHDTEDNQTREEILAKLNVPPPPPNTYYETPEERERALYELSVNRTNAQRALLGGGSVQEVLRWNQQEI